MWSWGRHRRTVSAQVGVQKPLTNCHGVHRLQLGDRHCARIGGQEDSVKTGVDLGPPYEPLPEERHLEEGISGEQRHRRGDVSRANTSACARIA